MEEVAAAMLLNVILSVDICHCMVPVFPVRVIVDVDPLQIMEGLAVAVPPTELGVTVTITLVVVALAHAPLVTTAL